MVHALLMKLISLVVKDGLVMGGGKTFLPNRDISSRGTYKKTRRSPDKPEPGG
jgi:hypothetical protein